MSNRTITESIANHREVNCLIHCYFDYDISRRIEKLFQPMLDYVNSARQFVSIKQKSRGTCSLSTRSDSSSNDSISEGIRKPTISPLGIQIFLHESNDRCYYDRIRDYLNWPLWNIKLNVALSSTYMKSCPPNDNIESYVSNGQNMPWWAIRTIHCGKEVIRLNLFVNHLEKMTHFYKIVIGKSPQIKRKDFCCFILARYYEVDIQFSLKALDKASPKPTPTDDILFEFFTTGYSSIGCLLSYNAIPLNENCWQLRDPEGNLVILHENTADA